MPHSRCQRARCGSPGGPTPAGVACWLQKQLTCCSGSTLRGTPTHRPPIGQCGSGQRCRLCLQMQRQCSFGDASYHAICHCIVSGDVHSLDCNNTPTQVQTKFENHYAASAAAAASCCRCLLLLLLLLPSLPLRLLPPAPSLHSALIAAPCTPCGARRCASLHLCRQCCSTGQSSICCRQGRVNRQGFQCGEGAVAR